ncbi:MAG: ORF6N domain-containing protein [Verrucomicrobiota bacterium]
MTPPLDQLIRTVRNKRVILDADLAAIYGVPTKALKQAVRRNPERFPEDFAIQLSSAEWRELRVRIASENNLSAQNQKDASNRSQFVTGYLQSFLKSSVAPFAFTDYGALMAANLLRSPQAVQMSIFVVRAFGRVRELLMGQAEILKRLAEIDTQLLGHDKALHAIWREIQHLLNPPSPPEKPEIGFHVREDTPEYRAKPRRSKKP